MQPNIPMKFAGYVAWILFCKYFKFGEKIYSNSRDIELFLGDYFLGRPVQVTVHFRRSFEIFEIRDVILQKL